MHNMMATKEFHLLSLSSYLQFSTLFLVPLLQGFYFTGDGARRDENGYIWMTGR